MAKSTQIRNKPLWGITDKIWTQLAAEAAAEMKKTGRFVSVEEYARRKLAKPPADG